MEARGPMPYLDVSRVLKTMGNTEQKDRTSHKMWLTPDGRIVRFAVSHPGGEVLHTYIREIRKLVGLEDAVDE